MNACKQAVMKSLPASRPFDEMTTNLLVSTENLLIELDQPKAEWGQVRTALRTLNVEACATPLIPALQTPMLTPLSPFRIPTETLKTDKPDLVEIEEAGLPITAQAEAPAIRPTLRNLWQFQRWWFIVLVLALVFLWIDTHYVQAGLQLTDWDFGLGLLAMVLATPAVVGALVHAYSHSGSSRIWVRYPGLVLCGIAAHFLVLLFSVGVPVLYLGALLVLMTLLMAALLF